MRIFFHCAILIKTLKSCRSKFNFLNIRAFLRSNRLTSTILSVLLLTCYLTKTFDYVIFFGVADLGNVVHNINISNYQLSAIEKFLFVD